MSLKPCKVVIGPGDIGGNDPERCRLFFIRIGKKQLRAKDLKSLVYYTGPFEDMIIDVLDAFTARLSDEYLDALLELGKLWKRHASTIHGFDIYRNNDMSANSMLKLIYKLDKGARTKSDPKVIDLISCITPGQPY